VLEPPIMRSYRRYHVAIVVCYSIISLISLDTSYGIVGLIPRLIGLAFMVLYIAGAIPRRIVLRPTLALDTFCIFVATTVLPLDIDPLYLMIALALCYAYAVSHSITTKRGVVVNVVRYSIVVSLLCSPMLSYIRPLGVAFASYLGLLLGTDTLRYLMLRRYLVKNNRVFVIGGRGPLDALAIAPIQTFSIALAIQTLVP